MNTPTNDYFQTLPVTAIYKTAADDDAIHTLSFHLTPEQDSALEQLEADQYNIHPKKRQYLLPDDQEQRCSTSTNNVQKVIDFITKAGLKATSSCSKKREVIVSGALQQFAKLLGISFHIYEDEEGGTFLAYHGAIQLPSDLSQFITTIEGLNEGLQGGHVPAKHLKVKDELDEASPIKRFAPKKRLMSAEPPTSAPTAKAAPVEPPKGYSPQDLTEMYRFPDNLGEGQTIGVIALGGTYQPSDLEAFCKMFKLPVPEVEVVGQEPRQNPQAKTVNDVEVNMDVQMVAGMVPKAKIVLYYAKTFREGFQAVLNDHKNNVSVVSTSWANGENFISQADRQQQQLLIRQMSMRGITVLAASGDDGMFQIGSNNKVPGINLPAGFPQVVACGGTILFRNGSEKVWHEATNASGGAFSNLYPAPVFQYEALSNYAQQFPYYAKNTCATPDMSVNASVTHHNIMIRNGKPFMAAGTSAATPILAGLVARLNTALGYRLGFFTNFLYQLMGSSAFNSKVPGNNGLPAAIDWDPCTGLGSPIGTNLLNLIKETEARWS